MQWFQVYAEGLVPTIRLRLDQVQEDRQRILRDRRIELVLDVGANAGQYATRLREGGYCGQIISFEPTSDAYARLQDAAADDQQWETRRLALGDESSRERINISANSYSSSFLPIGKVHVDAAPDAAFVGQQDVEMVTLDSLHIPDVPTMLKMDVQGYEPFVIRGARKSLQRITVVELEMSLVPLYTGQDLASAVCEQLRRLGFYPVGFDVAFSSPETGEILAIDGLFASAHP